MHAWYARIYTHMHIRVHVCACRCINRCPLHVTYIGPSSGLMTSGSTLGAGGLNTGADAGTTMRSVMSAKLPVSPSLIGDNPSQSIEPSRRTLQVERAVLTAAPSCGPSSAIPPAAVAWTFALPWVTITAAPAHVRASIAGAAGAAGAAVGRARGGGSAGQLKTKPLPQASITSSFFSLHPATRSAHFASAAIVCSAKYAALAAGVVAADSFPAAVPSFARCFLLVSWAYCVFVEVNTLLQALHLTFHQERLGQDKCGSAATTFRR